jgi:predicted ferric reductase
MKMIIGNVYKDKQLGELTFFGISGITVMFDDWKKIGYYLFKSSRTGSMVVLTREETDLLNPA